MLADTDILLARKLFISGLRFQVLQDSPEEIQSLWALVKATLHLKGPVCDTNADLRVRRFQGFAMTSMTSQTHNEYYSDGWPKSGR
jgi:hypothetical protein